MRGPRAGARCEAPQDWALNTPLLLHSFTPLLLYSVTPLLLEARRQMDAGREAEARGHGGPRGGRWKAGRACLSPSAYV